MSKMHSVERKDKEAIRKVSHPAIGEIYCLNEPEARATLHEVWVDKVYFQEGISISPDDIVFDVGANIGVFTLCAAKQGAHIYAYEPIPQTFEVLQHNIHLHGFESTVHARNIGLSDRAEEKFMFHYPALSVCDAWAAQDDWFKLMTENWENTLEILKVADPDEYKAIRSLESKSLQRGAVREVIERISASPVEIKCKFDGDDAEHVRLKHSAYLVERCDARAARFRDLLECPARLSRIRDARVVHEYVETTELVPDALMGPISSGTPARPNAVSRRPGSGRPCRPHRSCPAPQPEQRKRRFEESSTLL